MLRLLLGQVCPRNRPPLRSRRNRRGRLIVVFCRNKDPTATLTGIALAALVLQRKLQHVILLLQLGYLCLVHEALRVELLPEILNVLLRCVGFGTGSVSDKLGIHRFLLIPH